ncbi:MAG: CBS domain-containing protein [Alphaproteobacteria bacterium]|nr:CBS domain-containing protein [Alphaproteobacteria bacterium]
MQVKDIMTRDVVTVSGKTSVEEIAKLLLARHVSAVPVVDESGAVLGLVSEGDLMRRVADPDKQRRSWWLELFSDPHASAADYIKTHGRIAADVMTREIITVTEDMRVGEVAHILETARIKRVPVLRDGELVGIVSRANLLQALALTPPPEPGTGVEDRLLRERILLELAGVPGIQVSMVNVIVRDGIASVWGTVDSDIEQEAVRLAVESVVGEGNAKLQLGRIQAWSYRYSI